MKFLPKTLAECRALYEQLLFIGDKFGWPYDAAHEAANQAVADGRSNKKISYANDLWSIAKDVFRVN